MGNNEAHVNEETIHSLYARDLSRLDELFKNYQSLKYLDGQRASEFFREFKVGLERHIAWGDGIHFPIFEMKMGMMDCGPTQVMRMEHRQIKDCLKNIEEKVQAKNLQSDDEEVELLSILSSHNFKEEHILYPALDEMLDNTEKETVFAAMKNVGKVRYRAFC